MAIKVSDVDMSKISMSKPRKLDFGGSMIFINYDGGIQSLYVETPELYIPFDIQYFSDSDENGKYNVKVSFKDMDDNLKLKAFYDKLSEMDNFIKEKAYENTVSWFKGKKSKEVIDSLYSSMIKIHMDPETGEPSGRFPDSFGFKVVKKNKKIECSIYDKNNVNFDINHETDDPIDIEKIIVKGSKIKTVLKCNGIWIANGKFGCTWRAEQIRVKIPEGGLRDFAILSDDDDDDDNDNNENENEKLIEDSDDEEIIPPSKPEPEPEPKKKTRKVRVKSDK